MSKAQLKVDVVTFGACLHAAAKSQEKSLAKDLLIEMMRKQICPNERIQKSLEQVFSQAELKEIPGALEFCTTGVKEMLSVF